MSLTDEISTPYSISFATNSSCERQSKAFERSVSNAPKTRPWSRCYSHRIMEDAIKRIKTFQLVRTFMCTLCCHLLNVTGCPKQMSKMLEIIHF